jgi:L-fuculose-phosphate aldolase
MAAKEQQLRQEIARVGRLMYDKGFLSASDGNISARLEPGRILITPSGVHKGFLDTEQLMIVDEEGRPQGHPGPVGRRLRPTSEMPMLLEAYRRRADIGAVIHAHPPITIALSIAGIPLADCLLPEVIVFLGLIPTTEYATPSSEENVRAIRQLIANHDALVLQRHGTLTVGREPMEAFMRLETLEQNARIAFMLAQLGVNNPLPADEVRKLLEQRRALGLSRPGDEADFCAICGVCHNGGDHAPTLRPALGRAGGQPAVEAVDPATLRRLVAQVVQKTVGDGRD